MKPGPKGPSKHCPIAIAEALEKYIDQKCSDDKSFPVLAEFAYGIGVLREQLYEIGAADKTGRLSHAIKMCRQMKEFRVQTLGSRNKIVPTMAIFILKQLGWTDKVDQSVKIDSPPQFVMPRPTVEK